MAVRVTDSLKQQNNLKSFPVAYSEDIWIDQNKGEGTADYKDLQTLYNEGSLGGSTIQVDTLPTASATELGKIYQFIGTSTENYLNGSFYKCVTDGTDYSWVSVDTFPSWVGTKAKLEIALPTIPEGTKIMVTDDYDEYDVYTKEQVDELLDEKADIDNFEIYSTTETRIGTWIDGKPIYRKVIPIYENSQLVSGITPIPGTDYEYTGGIPSNIDKILNYNVPSLRNNYDPYVDNFTGIGVGPIVNFVPRLNGTFYFNSGYPDNISPIWCYCIIEYTKAN